MNAATAPCEYHWFYRRSPEGVVACVDCGSPIADNPKMRSIGSDHWLYPVVHDCRGRGGLRATYGFIIMHLKDDGSVCEGSLKTCQECPDEATPRVDADGDGGRADAGAFGPVHAVRRSRSRPRGAVGVVATTREAYVAAVGNFAAASEEVVGRTFDRLRNRCITDLDAAVVTAVVLTVGAPDEVPALLESFRTRLESIAFPAS